MKLRLVLIAFAVSTLGFFSSDQALANTRNKKRSRIQSNSYKSNVKRRSHRRHIRKPSRHVRHRRSRRYVRPRYRSVRRRVYRNRGFYRPFRPIVRTRHVHYIDDGCYDDGSDVFWNLHIGSGGAGIYIGN